MTVEKLTIKDTFRIWRDKINYLIDKIANIPATEDNGNYELSETTIGAKSVVIDIPLYVNSPDSIINGYLDGNAKTASTLKAPVKINGTEFDGTTEIKTENWGALRNIRISDAKGENFGNLVQVDGSDDYVLTLPSTIKADIDGNVVSNEVLSKFVSINGIKFNGSEDVINYGVCSTNSNVAIKEVTLVSPDFILNQGSLVTVKFLNKNTSTEALFLNVNETGSKPILSRGMPVSSTSIMKDGVFTFVYDGQAYDMICADSVDNKVNQYVSNENEEFPILASPITDSLIEVKSEESLFTQSITINPSMGSLTANTLTTNDITVNRELTANTLTTNDITVSDTLTANTLTTNDITVSDTLTTTNITTDDITVSDTLTTTNITTDDITATGTIEGISLTISDSITANNITSNGTIKGVSLVSDSVTANNITSNGTIKGVSLVGDSVTANNITSNGTIEGVSLVSDSVTANNITSNENIITSKIISLDKSILSVESNIYCIGYKIVTESVHSIGSTTYAEFFEKGEETEAGDIIALDSLSTEESYVKATKDSTLIVGVHSDSYGYILGGVEENINGYNPKTKFIPVGIKGRAYVNFIGKSKIGYPVVPSEIPGVGCLYDPSTNIEESTVEYSQSQIVGYIVEDSSGTEDLRKVKILLR